MRFDYIFLTCLAIFLLLPCAGAFPLNGGNGIVDATVYGVSTDEKTNGYYVDMSASRNDEYKVELIDSEDRAYSTNFGNTGSKYKQVYNGHLRNTIVFSYIPKNTVIKRLKVTPRSSDPFSIDWKGVPEVSANGIKMEYYGGKRGAADEHKYTWTFDVKITNLGKDTLTISPVDFGMKDANGWVYSAIDPDGAGIMRMHKEKLLPDEALRMSVLFMQVGEFSRPSEIILNNVSMDVGAWV